MGISVARFFSIFFLIVISTINLCQANASARVFCREALTPYKTYNLTKRADSVWEVFKESGKYPIKKHEKWLELTKISVRYEVLPSITRVPKNTFFFLGGLGYEVERFWKNRKFFNDLRKKGFQVVFVEMPGQGETLVRETVEKGLTPLEYTVDHQKDVLFEAIQALEDKKILPNEELPYHFGGLSYGGWLLSSMAKDPRFNQKMKSITLIAPGVKSLHKFRNPIAANPISDIWSKFLGNNPYVMGAMHKEITEFIFKGLPHLANDPLKVHGSSSLTTGIYLEEAPDNFSLAPKDLPVNLIIAATDELVPGEMHWDLAEFLIKRNPRHNKVMVIKPSGHDIPAEKGILRQKALSQILTGNIPRWSIMTPRSNEAKASTPDIVKAIMDKSTKKWLSLHYQGDRSRDKDTQ